MSGKEKEATREAPGKEELTKREPQTGEQTTQIGHHEPLDRNQTPPKYALSPAKAGDNDKRASESASR